MMRRLKLAVLALAIGAAALCLAGCGGSRVSMTIQDGKTTTEVSVPEGTTASEAVDLAGIRLNRHDTLSPLKADQKVSEGTKLVICRMAEVTVSDGSMNRKVRVKSGTVADALEECGITVGKHDYVNHDLKCDLDDGMTISVIEKRRVRLRVDGESRTLITTARTVSGLLKEQGIEIGKKDRLSPSKKTKLKEGMTVTVERVSTKTKTVKESIAFGTRSVSNSSMYQGQTRTRTPGVPGEKEVTYRITYVNGKEEGRKKLREKVLKQPEDQVVERGTKPKKQAKHIVSKKKVMDCDGSGHGYYIIKWSDGSETYQDF